MALSADRRSRGSGAEGGSTFATCSTRLAGPDATDLDLSWFNLFLANAE
jgi:hypothetical protein